MTENLAVTPVTTSILDEDSAYNYVPFADAINKAFNEAIGATGFLAHEMPPQKDIFLHRVGTKGLTKIYLNAFPESLRQQHNCNCCFSFIRKYGGLVKVQQDGTLKSVIWDVKVPEAFQPVVDALRAEVERRMIVARVSMYSTDSIEVHGYRESGGFNHLYLDAPPMNMKDFDPEAQFETLLANVVKVRENADKLQKALFAIECGKVDRPDKFIFTLNFFKKVLDTIPEKTNSRQLEHIVRYFENEAPVGAFHLTGSVVHTLLFSSIEDANLQTRGDKYMQATTPAKNDDVTTANELIKELNFTESFNRRWAKLTDFKLDWTPAEKVVSVAPQGDGGLFDKLLKPEEVKPEVILVDTSIQEMTYARFEKEVLPLAKSIDFKVAGRHRSTPCQIGAHAAAVNPDAEPLFLFDLPEYRWSTTSFGVIGGTYAADWGFTGGDYIPVTGIYKQHENVPMDHPYAKDKQQTRVSFFLGGLKAHAQGDKFGLCLFPEMIDRRLFKVRNVITEFSQNTPLAGKEEADAMCVFTDGGPVWQDGTYLELRVTTETGVRNIRIRQLF